MNSMFLLGIYNIAIQICVVPLILNT